MAGVLRPPYLLFKGDFFMKKYNYFLAMAGLFLALSLAACKEADDKPSTPNPPVVVDDGKTYLRITNNTPYDVNVYINDPPLYGDQASDTIRAVPKAGEERWELQPTAAGSNGETLYFEYLVPIGDSIIPFYANTVDSTKLVKLIGGEVNTTSAPDLPPINTNSSFVLVRNNTEDPIWVEQGGTGVSRTIYPFNAKVREVAANGEAVYVFENITSLSGFTVGPTARKTFPNTTLEKGVVYSFLYDAENGPQLFSQEHFDPNMADKIWRIPTSTETGKYFTASLLQSRVNVETDGYILVGRTSYDADMAYENQAGSQSYLGAIAPNGNVVERKIILRSNPSALDIRSFIDEGDELIFTGQAYYESADGTPVILGTEYNGESLFYLDTFLSDIDTNVESKYGQYIAKDKQGNYAIGGDLYNYDTRINQAYIDEVTRTGFASAEYERLWTQPSADCRPARNDGDYYSILFLAYDSKTDAYIVVADDKSVNSSNHEVSSLVYIINAADGSQKPVIQLKDYIINTIFQIGDDYYAAGTYLGAGKYRGFINKLNLESGAWDWFRPQFVDSKYPNGAAMIYNVVQDKSGSLILSGACVADYNDQEGHEGDIPWLVKYDLNAGTKAWERVYENYPGYYTYSANLSSIGSYLLELYNATTNQSTLVSTDLLGNIGGQEKAALPRDAELMVNQPGSPSVSAVVVPFTDAEMQESTTLTLAKGGSADVAVKGQWATYQWYVDGVAVGTTAATYTFASAAREPGVYTVMAVVTAADGAKRSAWRRIRVTN
jgi:hypothetical protein